jgi:hypothetical protein
MMSNLLKRAEDKNAEEEEKQKEKTEPKQNGEEQVKKDTGLNNEVN